ncbi:MULTISPECIES: (2Fe-2S)-binding protein [Mycolicibacter]|uniref:Bacterioferritin-associated ferredoxin n=1 Tax=Mycolicibacter virginiensis TaxID=1795032 RepID=A0A9X7NZ98_9MYCO|nr:MULTISPECIES: (2Fe-2S)-binding protein [Mycobacteriaceae]OBG38799.1 (2Fe-2S)-binding protein [Mycolicibacter heraklionensis]OBJ29261.1 (2Fe-2S)-binding protein [Mycolicibacter heraklionensis]PQM52852.1 (2Fe-2S)-binding protein [Mycolicibacter virginiensis]ULP49556.1 (2Fe-2S)-binding protein [Mycolicibacter virginiensis]
MYVCLCVGATNQMVSDAVAAGASTSKEVAAMCGAGGDCGRCRCTVRGIIEATLAAAPRTADNGALRHLALDISPVGSH